MSANPAKTRVGNVEKIFCASCQGPTSHTIKGSHETSWYWDEADVQGGAVHDLMVCNGCEAVTYRRESWSSEDSEPSITYCPPRGIPAPRHPKEFEELDRQSPLRSAYHETIAALNQELFTLSGAGVRLIIEGICNDLGIVDGEVLDKNTGNPSRKTNLEGRINGMVEKGLVTKSQANILHQIRFLGNDAAHQLDRPTGKIVTTALDIVEHILTQVYEHPELAKVLSARKRP